MQENGLFTEMAKQLFERKRTKEVKTRKSKKRGKYDIVRQMAWVYIMD